MRRLWSGLFAVLFSAAISSCGSSPTGSELQQHAVSNDIENAVVKTNEGGGVRFYYITKKKYFALNCSDPLKLQALITSFGFPSTQIALKPFDDVILKRDAGPTMSCETEQKVLYRAQLEGTTKYFFAQDNSKRELYMIGCMALVDAIGLRLEQAVELQPFLIENAIFDADDKYDVSCVSGVAMGSKVTWESQKEGNLDVTAGLDISQDYSAKLPNTQYADVEVALEAHGTDACAWVQTRKTGPVLIVSGRVPADFTNKSCSVKVKAAAGTSFEDVRVLKIQQRVRPTLANNCPLTKNLSSILEYPDCGLSANYGRVQFLDQTCVETFSFDTTSSKVKVAKLPGPGASCTVRFQAVLEDMVSDPLTLSITAVCGTGYTNVSGGCQPVSCGNGHTYNQRWTETITGGSRAMVCSASGVATQESFSCTVTGYISNGSSCELVKCGTHSYGDTWWDTIANGYLQKKCDASASAYVIAQSCNYGYNPDNNFTCTPVVCGNYAGARRVYGDSWSESVPNGSQAKYCNGNGVVSNGAISCSAGYTLSGSTCVPLPAACGSHASGSSWSTTIPHGRKYFSCSNGQTSVTSIDCNANYVEINGSCVLDTDGDPPVCRNKPSLPQCNRQQP